LGCETQGVQFHPESIRTENGMQIVGNFLKLLEKKDAEEQALANASTTL
jgi:GMP synthase-like glutamine amidotransferase